LTNIPSPSHRNPSRYCSSPSEVPGRVPSQKTQTLSYQVVPLWCAAGSALPVSARTLQSAPPVLEALKIRSRGPILLNQFSYRLEHHLLLQGCWRLPARQAANGTNPRLHFMQTLRTPTKRLLHFGEFLIPGWHIEALLRVAQFFGTRLPAA